MKHTHLHSRQPPRPTRPSSHLKTEPNADGPITQTLWTHLLLFDSFSAQIGLCLVGGFWLEAFSLKICDCKLQFVVVGRQKKWSHRHSSVDSYWQRPKQVLPPRPCACASLSVASTSFFQYLNLDSPSPLSSSGDKRKETQWLLPYR